MVIRSTLRTNTILHPAIPKEAFLTSRQGTIIRNTRLVVHLLPSTLSRTEDELIEQSLQNLKQGKLAYQTPIEDEDRRIAGP